MDKRIEDIVISLSKLSRYSSLLKRIAYTVPSSFLFELLFADIFETNGLQLSYEVNIRSDTNATIDFVYDDDDGARLCFELVSPEMSNQLKLATAPVETETEGVSTWSVLLESGNKNPHLRPEAPTIRMQEKLLEKIDKFSEPADSIFSTIVVDCTAFHFGHFDEEDCRMVIFGQTQNPYFQEYWSNSPIIGILNPENNRRGAKEFRERITAVVFIPEKGIHLFDKAFCVLNVSRSKSHIEAFCLKLKDIPIFRKLRGVPFPVGSKNAEDA